VRIIHDEGVKLGEAGYPVPSAPVLVEVEVERSPRSLKKLN